MNTSGLVLTILLTGAAVTTGVVMVKKRKQKKQLALEQEAERKRIEEEQQRAATSASTLWNGLSSAQTLALQKKLNAFYASGTLGGWDILDTAKNKILEWSGKAVDYADSLVKTAKAETYGPQGLDAFKAEVASIMPLQEDGLYGPKTTAAVKALQTYLNANGARLKEDGLYGDATDSATGWGIKALAGFPHFKVIK